VRTVRGLALILALLGKLVTAQEKPAANSDEKLLTIQEAEAIGVRNNPQITVGKLRALQAREFVREARSALMPEMNLSVTGVDSNPGSRIAAGSLTNPILFPRAAAGATVNQLITDFGHTSNLVSSTQFHAKAEDQNALERSRTLFLRWMKRSTTRWRRTHCCKWRRIR